MILIFTYQIRNKKYLVKVFTLHLHRDRSTSSGGASHENSPGPGKVLKMFARS